MRVKFSVDKSSLKRQSERVKEEIEAETSIRLQSIADDAIAFSKPFVDTGAYITSWSFIVGSGRPRGKSSRRRPRGQDAESMASKGRAQLEQDLNKVDLYNTTALFLSNGSPHSEYVEYKHNYRVFERLIIKHG